MAEATPSEVQLRDPLSEVTRKERRFLLGTSALGITLVKTGLVPTKIPAFGIEFAHIEQRALLLIIALVTIYFLIAFVIYATSDFLAWRLAYIGALRNRYEEKIKKQRDLLRLVPAEEEMRISEYLRPFRVFYHLSRPVSLVRALFEFVLPIAIGVFAVISLFTAKVPIPPGGLE